MKLGVVLLICLGACADDYGESFGSRDYRRWGQLKNYNGIYSSRYDLRNNYDRDYQRPRGQNDNAQVLEYYGTGGQISGLGGAFVGGNFAGSGGISAGIFGSGAGSVAGGAGAASAISGGAGAAGAISGGAGAAGAISGGAGAAGAISGGAGATGAISGGAGAVGAISGGSGAAGAISGGAGAAGAISGGAGAAGAISGGAVAAGAIFGGAGAVGAISGGAGATGAISGSAGAAGAISGGAGAAGAISGGAGAVGAISGDAGAAGAISGGAGAAGAISGDAGLSGAIASGAGLFGGIAGSGGAAGTISGGVAGSLLANLGLSAGLGAGISGSVANAIGVGISSNFQLNLEASVALGNREDLIRPCHLDDWQCIRRFFAVNSECSPSYGPVPDPLFLAQSTLYVPYVNLNLLLTNVKITGMGSAKVRDFYVNRVTGNLVFTIDIENLNETSPRSYWKYNRRGQEPYLLADATAFAFARLTLTVVIPRVPSLRLDLAEVSAYYDDDSPVYSFGPGISNNTNSLVLSANAELSANLQAVIRESFLFQAQLLAAIYIQQNICDFGLRLTST